MDSKSIRQTFLDFFKGKGHDIVPSAPIVIKDDPTLLFTNAGMNQFKDAFLGNVEVKKPRLADSQKCLRVSGKHNDLEEVGVDTYHHTMFEMLGNWSFGDYFKEEMIPWAWELLTEEYGMDKDRLYVTIFEGDEGDGLKEDFEASEAWAKILPENRILKANKKDNFWEMGETGPCGPCSEIHMDLRSDEDRKKIDGASLVNQDHPQVIEIWNLVFMQFNRLKDGSLKDLPSTHVDTGMGLERLTMALQNKQSSYDTDLFMPSIRILEELSGSKYNASDSKQDIAFRVVVDHIRAIAFSIADGQLPSNTGAGYVIRRILRRAVRYGFSFLDIKSPFLFRLIEAVVQTLGEQFDELKQQQQLIEKVIQEEEQSFLRTLEKGIQVFEQYKTSDAVVDGAFAFELYDTFGFPIDLTQLMAVEKGWSVNMIEFQEKLEEQKTRSRSASKMETDDWVEVFKDEKEEFIGYDYTEANVKISRYRKVKQKGKDLYQLVFNLSPFYPEGGGQVGDTGYIDNGEEKISILDTKKEANLIVHFVKSLPENLEAEFRAHINASKRQNTAANHTATHLMHEALRSVLGEHVEQKGSLVNGDYLRFDFSHFQKVTDEEVREIENLVNKKIRENISLNEERQIPIDEAKAKGAMALFGEKYGDVVRMIQFGSSVELCGGTHVKSTGEIALFKITSEAAVAAGIRRVEAMTGERALDLFFRQNDELEQMKEMLKQPKDLVTAIEKLQKENNQLQKEIEGFKLKVAGSLKQDLIKKIVVKDGINTLIEEVDMDAGGIKNLAFQLKAEVDNLFMVLASKKGAKPSLTVLISENLVEKKDWNAGQIVRDLAKHIQGGGGGQAFFATAGGKNPEGIEKALKEADQLF